MTVFSKKCQCDVMQRFKMKIELWDLESDFLGILVPAATGIYWTNQTGGTACGHPEVEGFYIPLPDGKLTERLLDVYEKEYNPALVQSFLKANSLNHWFEPLELTELPLHEAWIPVRVNQLRTEPWDRYGALEPIEGMTAIITYSNSD